MAPPKKAETDTQMDRDLQAAEEAAKRRLAAPPVSYAGVTPDARRALVNQLKSEGVIPEGFSSLFGDRAQHTTLIGRGYRPVMRNGVWVQCPNGDPLYMIEEELANQSPTAAREEARLRQAAPSPAVQEVQNDEEVPDGAMKEETEIKLGGLDGG